MPEYRIGVRLRFWRREENRSLNPDSIPQHHEKEPAGAESPRRLIPLVRWACSPRLREITARQEPEALRLLQREPAPGGFGPPQMNQAGSGQASRQVRLTRPCLRRERATL